MDNSMKDAQIFLDMVIQILDSEYVSACVGKKDCNDCAERKYYFYSTSNSN